MIIIPILIFLYLFFKEKDIKLEMENIIKSFSKETEDIFINSEYKKLSSVEELKPLFKLNKIYKIIIGFEHLLILIIMIFTLYYSVILFN